MHSVNHRICSRLSSIIFVATLAARPLISIIVPCYRQAQYLDETLRSLLAQTYTHWECLIVNDGSPDDTEVVAQQWCSKDSRFVYISKANGGLSSARNAGLAACKGDWVQFLDADDLLAPDKFAASVQATAQDAAVDLVISNFCMFSGTAANTSAPFCKLSQDLFTYAQVLARWDLDFTIPIHCGLFSKQSLEGFLFNETLRAKEDWLLWLHVFRRVDKPVFIDRQLAMYRLHPASMTKDFTHMHNNFVAAYNAIFNTLSDADKQVIYRKVLELYSREVLKYPHYEGFSLADLNEVERGRRALGPIGSLLFRILRKTGHLLLQKESKPVGK